MLLDPSDCTLSQSGDDVLARLSAPLLGHIAPETHAAVIELRTSVHLDAARAVGELATLRSRLSDDLRAMRLRAACAGTYPLVFSEHTRVSGTERYRAVADSMRALARREPTMALHVHVGVPDSEDAVRVLNGFRHSLPVMLALSANSPFCQGRDSGFASLRTVIFQGFPRTGAPRRFKGYADYIDVVDAMIASGALPDPSFIWWDVRLQPALGTVELRVMDAQSTLIDNAALIALVQSLACLELEGEPMDREIAPEVLAENRFIAARDGMQARLIDPDNRRLVPVRELLDDLLTRCGPHADALGCQVELDHLGTLAAANGADRQRAWADRGGLPSVMPRLTERFAAPRPAGLPITPYG
jgi:glutamate---cysteine ligase / carboxylate-amine ligase